MELFALLVGVLLLIVLAFWIGFEDGQRRIFHRFESHFARGTSFQDALERERVRLGITRT